MSATGSQQVMPELLQPSLGAVEILTDPQSKVWYCGHIVDVSESNTELYVEFEGNVWPQKRIPVSQARTPVRRARAETEEFSPRIGEAIELRVNQTEHAPAYWVEATVQNVKSGFYFVVRQPGTAPDGATDSIVENIVLRPLSTKGRLTDVVAIQENFELPPQLQIWVTTQDALGCLNHIQYQSGLTALWHSGNTLKLFGDKHSVQRSKMLLEVHVKHQNQIQSFQSVREKRLRALETKRSRLEGTGFKHSVKVQVATAMIPRIIGKKGEVVRSLEEKYGVSIRILSSEGSDETTVCIHGNNLQEIENAKGEVEYVEEALPIDAAMNRWVLGKNGKTIISFKESCGLAYASLDRESQQLSLYGTKSAVEDALAMFETHIMYYPVFAQMGKEISDIIEQLEDFGDWDARWEWRWSYEEDEDREKWNAKWKGARSKGKGKLGKSGKGNQSTHWSTTESSDWGGKGHYSPRVRQSAVGESLTHYDAESAPSGPARGRKTGKRGVRS